jgi:hypothetical protein
MQLNYEEMMKKQQQDYQRSRDPFQYGQQVAQRRYSEIMSNLDAQRGATQQSYGDLYSQARQRAVRGQAAGGPTLSGGMGQQQRDFVSAIEMQELGRIGTAREGAMRDLYSRGQAAFSNAQLEGQQATQMEVQNRQTQLQLYQQRQSILNDSSLSIQEKQAQLELLGQPLTPEELASGQASTAAGTAFGAVASIGIPSALMAGGAVVRTGGAQVAALTAWNTTGLAAAKKSAFEVAKAAVKNMPLGAPGRQQAMNLAYKKAMLSAKAPTLGVTGKIYNKILGGAVGKKEVAKVLGKTAFKWASRAIGIYAIVSGVETLAELLGVAGGRGFSALISKEGTGWDKFLEGIGL